jgi:hypothetical protein
MLRLNLGPVATAPGSDEEALFVQSRVEDIIYRIKRIFDPVDQGLGSLIHTVASARW